MQLTVSFKRIALYFMLAGTITAANAASNNDEWVGQFVPLALESEAQATQVAKDFITQLNFDGKPNNKIIEVLHIEGQTLSPYLQSMLIVLSQAGYDVRGTFVSKGELEEAAKEVDARVLSYNIRSRQDHRSWISRLTGMPQGITFLSHFLNGKRWKFSKDSSVFKFARNTTGLAALTAVGMGYLMPHLNGFLNSAFDMNIKSNPTNGAELAATTTLLGAWIFHFLQFRREWSSFRTQAKTVKVSPGAESGSQIQVKPNSKFFAASCIAQEHILTGIITTILYQFGTVDPQSLTDILSIVLSGSFVSTAAALSYVKFEEVMAARMLEASQVEQANPGKAATLKKQVGFLSNIFYNVLYPVTSYIARFMGGTLAGIPLMTLGAGAWWWSAMQTSGNYGDGPRPLTTGTDNISCAAVLRLR